MLLATIVAVTLVGSVVVQFLRRATRRLMVPAIGVGVIVGLDVGLLLVALHARHPCPGRQRVTSRPVWHPASARHVRASGRASGRH
jgi:hypothetical protein